MEPIQNPRVERFESYYRAHQKKARGQDYFSFRAAATAAVPFPSMDAVTTGGTASLSFGKHGVGTGYSYNFFNDNLKHQLELFYSYSNNNKDWGFGLTGFLPEAASSGKWALGARVGLRTELYSFDPASLGFFATISGFLQLPEKTFEKLLNIGLNLEFEIF